MGKVYHDATASRKGLIPAADKAKLDAATDAATASAIVRRDANKDFAARKATFNALIPDTDNGLNVEGAHYESGIYADLNIKCSSTALARISFKQHEDPTHATDNAWTVIEGTKGTVDSSGVPSLHCFFGVRGSPYNVDTEGLFVGWQQEGEPPWNFEAYWIVNTYAPVSAGGGKYTFPSSGDQIQTRPWGAGTYRHTGESSAGGQVDNFSLNEARFANRPAPGYVGATWVNAASNSGTSTTFFSMPPSYAKLCMGIDLSNPGTVATILSGAGFFTADETTPTDQPTLVARYNGDPRLSISATHGQMKGVSGYQFAWVASATTNAGTPDVYLGRGGTNKLKITTDGGSTFADLDAGTINASNVNAGSVATNTGSASLLDSGGLGVVSGDYLALGNGLYSTVYYLFPDASGNWMASSNATDADLGYKGAAFFFTPGSAPGSPVEGQMYYDSTGHHLYVYNGTAWKQLDN